MSFPKSLVSLVGLGQLYLKGLSTLKWRGTLSVTFNVQMSNQTSN
jgi:hypothetical protein